MKREVSSCPYRKLQAETSADGEAVATCDILARLSGISIDHRLLRVTAEQCDYCCNESVVASPTTLNPGVASYLYTLTCEVIQAGGVQGCSVESAEELQKLAFKHLRHGAQPEQETRRPEFGRPCLYLGDPADPPTENGEPASICRHEHMPRTTTDSKCKACHHYDPRLELGTGVSRWAVGVTTAPRRKATLGTTLDSLAAAGWDDPMVFAEPKTRISNAHRHLRIVRRQQKLGAWPNFLLGLNELVLSQPDADAYLMVQDDTLFVKNTRQYLERTLWPNTHTGVVSLHTPSHHVPEDETVRGFFPRTVGWGAWGAMAFIFPNASARAMLRHPAVVNHRSRGCNKGTCNVDSVVGHWCNIDGFEFYLHCPSLTQHIGLTTTLWSHDSLEGRRSASDFPGDEFDARELLD